MTRAVRLHLSSLVAVFFVLLAFGAWLRRAEHLLEPTTLIFGASYADVMGRMPASLLLAAVCVVGRRAGRACRRYTHAQLADSGRHRPLRAVSVGGEVYSSVVQRFVVAAQRADPRDARTSSTTSTPRAAPSRSTRVEERELSGDALLTAADISRNADDARERAAVGPPAAARDVRPDPGDPHLLRVRLGGQRPLPRRTASCGR